MESLREELKKLGCKWILSNEYPLDEFKGRYFISSEELEQAAIKADCMTKYGAIEQEKFMKLYECQIDFDYEGSSQSTQWDECEIIFNTSEKGKMAQYRITKRVNGEWTAHTIFRQGVEEHEAKAAFQALKMLALNPDSYSLLKEENGKETLIED